MPRPSAASTSWSSIPNERVVVNPLRIKNWILSELEASLLLYFGGVSRDSATIIDEQSANVKRNDGDAIEAMHALKAEAIAMKENLLKGDFDGLVESVQAGWEAKKKMARSISNPQIDEDLRARAGRPGCAPARFRARAAAAS